MGDSFKVRSPSPSSRLRVVHQNHSTARDPRSRGRVWDWLLEAFPWAPQGQKVCSGGRGRGGAGTSDCSSGSSCDEIQRPAGHWQFPKPASRWTHSSDFHGEAMDQGWNQALVLLSDAFRFASLPFLLNALHGTLRFRFHMF